MVEFHPNFSALHPHIDNMSARSFPSVHLFGMICETMINVTQVDERGNKSGSKDGSTICDNYSRSSMPEDNFFK
ncbi:hypothetical protein TNCV_1291041 [Trichonephila clavipes]|nr:hypothetical protein TNCV_1291041 [Trichonephila clavipes]